VLSPKHTLPELLERCLQGCALVLLVLLVMLVMLVLALLHGCGLVLLVLALSMLLVRVRMLVRVLVLVLVLVRLLVWMVRLGVQLLLPPLMAGLAGCCLHSCSMLEEVYPHGHHQPPVGGRRVRVRAVRLILQMPALFLQTIPRIVHAVNPPHALQRVLIGQHVQAGRQKNPPCTPTDRA
jgi:hypothetical protein